MATIIGSFLAPAQAEISTGSARDVAPAPAESADAGTPKRLRRVLLIHAAGPERTLLENGMRGRFDVRVADSAEDGWQAVLIDQSIRAVVASLPMIEIDGYGLLQRMRRSKAERIANTPVIVVARGEDEALGELVTSFGASDVTPFGDLDGLRTCLQGLLEPGSLIRTSNPSRILTTLCSSIFPATDKPARAADAEPAPEPAMTPALVPAPVADRPQPPEPDKKEIPMARLESLNKVLKTLQSSSPGVEASALISYDGLMIASALAQDMDETRVAAMTATLLNLGTRAATELRRGEVSEVIVRGESGYAVMLSAGRGALLLVLATEATPLGLIFFDMREAIKGIKTIL
ncbi:MAG: roadblock/LC7 domain-containing protein [Burkholderiaceae bacterium]